MTIIDLLAPVEVATNEQMLAFKAKWEEQFMRAGRGERVSLWKVDVDLKDCEYVCEYCDKVFVYEKNAYLKSIGWKFSNPFSWCPECESRFVAEKNTDA